MKIKQKNENEGSDSSNEFEGQTIINNEVIQERGNETTLSLGNSNINLEKQFIHSGTTSETKVENGATYPINPKPITNEYFNIRENRISLGKGNTSYSNQTIYMRSNYKINFNRNFEIKGSLKYAVAKNLSGFTLAFHNDRDYVSKNVNATLGLYSAKGIWSNSSWAGEVGLADAIVIEFDPYNMKIQHDNNGTTATANYYYGDDLSKGQHIQILETNNVGNVTKSSIKDKDISLSDYDNS